MKLLQLFTARRALVLASLMTLVGLSFFIWAVLSPTPLSIMVAMSVGQGIGTLASLLYLAVVALDLYRRRVFRGQSDARGGDV